MVIRPKNALAIRVKNLTLLSIESVLKSGISIGYRYRQKEYIEHTNLYQTKIYQIDFLLTNPILGMRNIVGSEKNVKRE